MATQTKEQKVPINCSVAKSIRRTLRSLDVVAVNLIGDIGCGKSALIQKSIDQLVPQMRIAVIACAARWNPEIYVRPRGAQFCEITAEDGHLNADLIAKALTRLDIRRLDLLFIENAGSIEDLVDIDLGQHLTVSMFAADNTRTKQFAPVVRSSHAIVLSKIDSFQSAAFDRSAFYNSICELNSQAPIFEVSSFVGTGIDKWTQWLVNQVRGMKCQASHWFG
jgi:hydrogenase nickel incorporation protein HypB